MGNLNTRNIINLLLSLLIAILSVMSVNYVLSYISKGTVELTLHLKISQQDVFQVFYDTGDGFSEQNSIKKTIEPTNGFQIVKFYIPSNAVNRLRIDTGIFPERIITIKHIFLGDNLGNDIKDVFKQSYDVDTDLEKGILLVRTTGQDPQIYTGVISQLYMNEQKGLTNARYIFYAMCLLLSYTFYLGSKQSSIGYRFKSKEFWIILFFLIMISLPLLSMIIGFTPKTLNNENRNLAAKPVLSKTNIGNYFKEYEKYFNDHFGFRDQLIYFNNLLNVKCFKVSTNPLVIIGENNWLYYTGDKSLEDYKGLSRFTSDELEIIRRNLETEKEWLAKRGIQFLVVVAPNKESIYPEYLPNNIRKINDGTRLEQLKSYLQEKSDINVLDLRTPLLEHKGNSLLYYRTDTHWNEYGAFVAYQQIINELQKEDRNLKPNSYTDFSVVSETKKLRLDLANMLAMDLSDEMISFKPNNPWKASFVEVDKTLYPNSELLIAKEIDNKNAPRLLMFRDSFTNNMVDFLSEHFSRSTYVWDYSFNPEVIELESPDIVILEIVERALPRLLTINE
ncbi:MAG: alginate O-acetyltransferase AlgX-related protein [Desulfitobacterium sp.]